jgi:hypothetical protein
MFELNPNSLEARNSRVADKIILSSRYARNYLITWIPACAGMTQRSVRKIM